jgi:hypothetical protein
MQITTCICWISFFTCIAAGTIRKLKHHLTALETCCELTPSHSPQARTARHQKEPMLASRGCIFSPSFYKRLMPYLPCPFSDLRKYRYAHGLEIVACDQNERENQPRSRSLSFKGYPRPKGTIRRFCRRRESWLDEIKCQIWRASFSPIVAFANIPWRTDVMNIWNWYTGRSLGSKWRPSTRL